MIILVFACLFLSVHADPNPNCLSRVQCTPTYPKYPDQHTLCLNATDGKWRCAALASRQHH